MSLFWCWFSWSITVKKGIFDMHQEASRVTMTLVIYLYNVLLLFVRIMRQGMDLSYLPREQNDGGIETNNIFLQKSYLSGFPGMLTHWGRVTHICVSKLTIIGSDNGLSPDRRQAIICTNAGLLLIGPLGTNLNEILIEILTFSFKKMRLKVSAKWRPFVSTSMC